MTMQDQAQPAGAIDWDAVSPGDGPIDWAAIEANGHVVSDDDKRLREIEELARHSAGLVRAAEHVEDGAHWEQQVIAEAHADGQSVDGYLREQQGGDMDWSIEEEERAAGYPGAMPADYQDPGLTAACRADADADGM